MMDDQDMVPNAMAIRNAKGELVGKFTVDFDTWAQANAIAGGVM